MEAVRELQHNSIVEAISWMCSRVQDNHDWISEFSLALDEKTIPGELYCDV